MTLWTRLKKSSSRFITGKMCHSTRSVACSDYRIKAAQRRTSSAQNESWRGSSGFVRQERSTQNNGRCIDDQPIQSEGGAGGETGLPLAAGVRATGGRLIAEAPAR